jgi:mRNA interferase RelE/StbE
MALKKQASSPYRLRVSAEIASLLRGLHPQLKRKIKAALKLIAADPDAGKSLREELKGLKSFRTGRFRIIYRTSPRKIIEIIAVGPRRTIYEETYRIVRKEKT